MNGKFILLLIMLVICTASQKIYNIDNYYKKQIYKLLEKSKCKNKKNKLNLIMYYSKKYGHSPLIIAKLIKVESSFNENKINKFTKAIGLMQIMTNCHTSYIYGVDIEKNIEFGCKLLRNYIMYANSYSNAFLIYGGWMTKNGKKRIKERNKYIKDILK